MICEKCKIREANIQITEIVNGVRTNHYYCAECASEMNFDTTNFVFEGDFPLAKLLSSLLAQTSAAQQPHDFAQVTCPTCGTTYEDFIKNSKFGCPDCYKVFGLLIDDNIKSLQGSDTHKGKKPRYYKDEISQEVREDLTDSISEGVSPKQNSNVSDLYDLKAKLKKAVKDEEFEEAARLRDEIRKLEAGGNADE